MSTTFFARIRALLLIVEAILITACFAILQATFEFPTILNKPASHVLPLFYAHQNVIVPTYYAFTVSAMLLISIALCFHHVLTTRPSLFMRTVCLIAPAIRLLAACTKSHRREPMPMEEEVWSR